MTAPTSRVGRGPSGRGSARVPWVLVLPALVGLLFLLLPLVGLLVRAPWATMGRRIVDPEVLTALWLSLSTSTAATLVSLILGVPLAWLLART